MTELQRTPLYDVHRELNAKMVGFGGWEMPVQYEGIIKEHKTVREKAGLFDVSHMGELLVEGPDALDALQRLITNDLSKTGIGRAMYTPITKEDGGIIDDLLIYNLGLSKYLLVVNASNKDKDFKWIKDHLRGEVDVADKSHEYALIALQGPLSQKVLQRLTTLDLRKVKFYSFAIGAVAEVPCLVSRTGYTGEDGFELYCHPEEAERLWRALLQEGSPDGVVPAGLGARDTLRFEACLPLYGQELSEDINPFMAGLGWTVKFDKGEFVGRKALLQIKEQGVTHKLVGLKMVERGIPRTGYSVEVNGRQVGWVTTGSFAPTLNANLALALVKPEYAEIGTEMAVVIRKKAIKAEIFNKPFYKRSAK